MLDAAGLRAAVRAGEHTGPTAGLAPGYTQANLVALPEADAFDFLRFCVANPKPCPVLDVSDPGSPEPARIGARRRPAHRRPALPDLPRRRARRRADRRERALARRPRRLPDRLLVHLRARAARPRGCRSATSSRASTSRCTARAGECTPAGRFSGPLVVSMRPMTPEQAIRATQITSRYGPVHGAPGPHRRRRTRSGSTTSARPTTATRWRSATASCRCSGPAA